MALGLFALLLIILTFKQDTRRALLIAPIWFLILAVAYLSIRKRAAALSMP